MDKELLQATIDKLKDIAEVCYMGDVETGVAGMGLVLTDIEKIALEITDEGIQSRLINDALMPILNAMDKRDGTELGDRISYELIPIIEEMMV